MHEPVDRKTKVCADIDTLRSAYGVGGSPSVGGGGGYEGGWRLVETWELRTQDINMEKEK